MSIFSVSNSLTGLPPLRYGIWYSYGSTQSPGYMLTLTNFWASYLALALGLLVGWAVSRLWRIACALLFYFSYTREPSWEESQNNVFIVNSRNALEACIDSFIMLRGRTEAYRRHGGSRYNALRGNRSPRYRRARYVIISVIVIGSFITGLKLTVPLLISLVPLTKLGITAPRACGNTSSNISSLSYPSFVGLEAETITRAGRWADAAFATLDRIISDQPIHPGTSSQVAGRTVLPQPEMSLTYSCPADVSPCSVEHPFTFSSQYTLFSHHFGLNIGMPFSLRVSDTCYRPSGVALPVNLAGWEDIMDTPLYPNITRHGFYYGPVRWMNGVFQNHTLTVDPGREIAQIYGIIGAYAKTDQGYHIGWSPNSTLIQGGDTSLLLYYLGKVRMTKQSSDPIFATDTVKHSHFLQDVYFHESSTVPVICDTKYVFCDVNRRGNDCSSPGGISEVLSWLENGQNTTWAGIRSLLKISLNAPPIYWASDGWAAGLAAQSADTLQYAPDNATTFGELGRLSKAGMVMLASAGQVWATGYWKDTSVEAQLAAEGILDFLCNKVEFTMESSTVTTIPVIPYSIFVLISVLIVAVSYSGAFPLPKRMLLSSLNRLFNTWTLHLPGQLHREVTEKLRGRDFKLVNMVDNWPATPYQSGPIITTRHGAQRFSSGNTGSLENIAEDTEEYPLNTRVAPLASVTAFAV